MYVIIMFIVSYIQVCGGMGYSYGNPWMRLKEPVSFEFYNKPVLCYPLAVSFHLSKTFEDIKTLCVCLIAIFINSLYLRHKEVIQCLLKVNEFFFLWHGLFSFVDCRKERILLSACKSK